MQKRLIKILSAILVLTVFISVFSAVDVSAALSASQIRNEINKLEQQSKDLEADINNLQKDINAQQKLKDAIQQKIAVVQQQINICNSQILKINNEIAANNAEIEKNNKQIEDDKLTFKKRLRAIYMSNTGSNVQVLLGADDFADFLQLAQLTSSVSARDKLLMEKLAKAIEKLQKKQEENNKLLEEQVELKNVINEKKKELQADSDAIQSVINDIGSDKQTLVNQNAKLENEIKSYRNTLNSLASTSGSSGGIYDGSDFLWPTPGYYRISAYFQGYDSVHNGDHDGIDIIGAYRGQISGAKVVAIADGTVEISKNSCPHNEPKNGWTCGCNGNFGNYVKIQHGTKDGKGYASIYGHLASTAVRAGQAVKKGQVIGYVGSTGWSTGYHLHFGIAVNGGWKNPLNYYKKVG